MEVAEAEMHDEAFRRTVFWYHVEFDTLPSSVCCCSLLYKVHVSHTDDFWLSLLVHSRTNQKTQSMNFKTNSVQQHALPKSTTAHDLPHVCQ
jgi:hypothetical protein